MNVADTSAPVVVLNAYTHCGVSVIRSLGRLGVPVYAVHETRKAPSLRSRYCRGVFELSLASRSAAASVESLVRVAETIGERPLLIPTEDVSCLFLADNSDELEQAYRFPEQPRGLARALSSKREMYTLCKKFDVPTPEASFPTSREDVIQFAQAATFPLMVKPVDNRDFQDFPGAGKAIARDRSELVEICDRLSRGGPLPEIVMQEFIPGGADSVWMFNGYFNRESKCLIGITGKKLRQYPPYVGQTSLGICESNTAVLHTTQQFMRSLGYRGILDIGFRYDLRDGRYKLLDVNPRIGSAFRLFVGEDDLDVARAFYLDMTGQPIPKTDARESRKLFVENYDLVASLKYVRDGNLGLREWISSLRGVEECAWLAADDLRPFGAMWIDSAAYVLSEARTRWRKRWTSQRRAASTYRRKVETNRGESARLGGQATPVAPRQRRVNEHFAYATPYWDDVYERKDLDGVVYREREERVVTLIDSLQLATGSSVLEVGCGAGRLTLALAQRRYRVRAIDSVPSMVETTQRRLRRASAAAAVDVGDAHALAEADGTASLVVAVGVVPWLVEPSQAMAEMARVASVGGYVLVSSDNRARLTHLLDPRFHPLALPLKRALNGAIRWLGFWSDRPESYARTHYLHELDELVARAGLVKVAGQTVGFGPFTILGRPIFSEGAAITLHRRLQRLADHHQIPFLRTLGSNYLVLAEKAQPTPVASAVSTN